MAGKAASNYELIEADSKYPVETNLISLFEAFSLVPSC